MMILIPAVLVSLIAVVTGVSALTYRTDKNVKGDDGTTVTLPLGFKNLRDFILNVNDPDAPQILLDKARQLKAPIMRIPLPFTKSQLFIVNDCNIARKILADPQSTKWKVTMKILIDTTGGDNIVTEEGHRWKHVRKSTMTAFSSQNVKKMVNTINIIMKGWMNDSLQPAVSTGEGMDILDEMIKITASVIAEAAFDYHLSDEERVKFITNLRTCFFEMAVKGSQSFIRSIPYLRCLSSGIRQGKRASDALYKHCDMMLRSYRAKVTEDPSLRKPHKLIDMLMNDMEYANEEERIRDMIAYVIGGFDTTANTLAFALLELARHPKEQKVLREALQKYETEEEARNCLELKHVIRETLRLRPPGLGSVRLLGNDIEVEVPNDSNETRTMTLPSGSATLSCYYAIQRDTKVFQNPDAFMPSRWDNPSEEMNKSLLTFSLGRRNCQGQALAYAETTEILLKICRDYEIHVVDEGKALNLVMYKPVGTILSFSATNH